MTGSMLLVVLRFSERRARAVELMAGHSAWLQRGCDDGVFLLSGSLQPGLGGVILAGNASRACLEERVSMDPFVTECVVVAEFLEVSPSKADPRLGFRLPSA
jgi:uncharacterized protein YciI